MAVSAPSVPLARAPGQNVQPKAPERALIDEQDVSLRAAPATGAPAAAARDAPSSREIAALVKRGRVHFEAGDVAAARLLFRRAANAGDAGAALSMGATYDPAVLDEHLVRGVSADVEAARSWYEKARQLGSPEGTGRLDRLVAHR